MQQQQQQQNQEASVAQCRQARGQFDIHQVRAASHNKQQIVLQHHDQHQGHYQRQQHDIAAAATQHRTDTAQVAQEDQEGGEGAEIGAAATEGDDQEGSHPYRQVRPRPIAATIDMNAFFAEIGIDIGQQPQQKRGSVARPKRQASEETTTTAEVTSEDDNPVPLQATIEQRRQHKAENHRQTGADKKPCNGCQIAFWQFADMEHRICHNCVKIVDAVRSQARRYGGRVQVVQKNGIAIIMIACRRGHHWENDFRPRQGQRWCSQCRREAIAEHKARIRQEEQQERERIQAEQEQMYQQAFAEVAQEAFVKQATVDPHANFIQQVVDAIVDPQAHQAINPDDPAVQVQMVEVIIAIGENRIDRVIRAIFNQVHEEQQQRVERRIKFMVHPDRNTHCRAKDAFQMLSSSNWRRKKSKSLSSRAAFTTTTTTTTESTNTELPQWVSWCILFSLHDLLLQHWSKIQNNQEQRILIATIASAPIC